MVVASVGAGVGASVGVGVGDGDGLGDGDGEGEGDAVGEGVALTSATWEADALAAGVEGVLHAQRSDSTASAARRPITVTLPTTYARAQCDVSAECRPNARQGRVAAS